MHGAQADFRQKNDVPMLTHFLFLLIKYFCLPDLVWKLLFHISFITWHNLHMYSGSKGQCCLMLTIGNVLLLEPKNTVQAEKFKCRLVEREGDMLYIDYPINIRTNKTAFLLDGTQLKAVFVHGHSAFCFDTEVTGRVKHSLPMIKLYFPGNEYVMKIQRRQFVRIETAVDVALHPLNGEFEPFTAVTDDISAGGILVQARSDKSANLTQGMNLNVVIVLPMQNGDYHYMQIHSKIVRILKDDQTGFSKYSLQFEEVAPRERQHLLRFTFERQLEMKKKGLDYLE
jgi:c-di-GMP-binding flagellar brake protein YcgR